MTKNHFVTSPNSVTVCLKLDICLSTVGIIFHIYINVLFIQNSNYVIFLPFIIQVVVLIWHYLISFDLESIVHRRRRFESSKALWILTFEEAIQLAYRTLVIPINYPLIPEIMHGRTNEELNHEWKLEKSSFVLYSVRAIMTYVFFILYFLFIFLFPKGWFLDM